MFKLLVVLTTLVIAAPEMVFSYASYKPYYRRWDSGKREATQVHFVFNNKVNENQQISLLGFKAVNGLTPKPSEKYDREKHFGAWIEKKGDNTCLDTRGKVLRRDSLSRVDINSSCRVTAGEWHDPYTNAYIKKAKDIQIDHVVALSNAYRSGAFEWSSGKRCLYANYMGNNFHLLAVDGEENEKKLDYDPSRYMPPNNEFTCEYLKTWLKIKNIWNLRMTYKEAVAINEFVQEKGCNRQDFLVPAAEIVRQKQYIQNNLNYCKQ